LVHTFELDASAIVVPAGMAPVPLRSAAAPSPALRVTALPLAVRVGSSAGVGRVAVGRGAVGRGAGRVAAPLAVRVGARGVVRAGAGAGTGASLGSGVGATALSDGTSCSAGCALSPWPASARSRDSAESCPRALSSDFPSPHAAAPATRAATSAARPALDAAGENGT
jgi:hypothetical protein